MAQSCLLDRSQSDADGRRDRDDAEAAQQPEAPAPGADLVLAMQRSMGNQAVARLLAGSSTSGAMLLRQPGEFHGDGRHKPDDAAYGASVGTADAARLRKAGTLSPEDRSDVNAKLKYFQGAGHAAYVEKVKPALVEVTQEEIDMSADAAAGDEPFTDAQLKRMGEAAQVNVLFSDIEKLKNDRILTWKETASLKEPKPMREALDIAVAMVALGMGGVFGLFISHGMKGEYLKDFVYLAGLELVDKVAEDSYEFGMHAAGEALQQGTMAALSEARRKPNVEGALASDKDDLLNVYAEAMRLQVRAETSEQQTQFNLGATATYRRSALLLKSIALTVIYQQLFNQPQLFHRELTEGFIRLMDENAVGKTANEDYGGDKQRAWREDEDLHEVEERKGNLVVLPKGIHSLGNYGNPLLNFGNFGAIATGVNSKTLMKLSNTPVQDLPLTLAFRYWVENPFYRIIKGGDWIQAWFTRTPGGDIYLDPDISEGAEEWLASYYSGISRELEDDEREKFAPLGAKKLYDATKHMPIIGLSNSDIL